MAKFIDAVMINKDGFLVGTTPVQEDPMSPGNWLLPPDCVLVDLPKEIKPGYAYKLTKKKTWKEVKIDQKTRQEVDLEVEKQKQIEFIKKNSIEFKENFFEISETFINAIYFILKNSNKKDVYNARCANLENLQEEKYIELTTTELIELANQIEEKIYLQYFK